MAKSKKLDLTGHPCVGMSSATRKMFEKIVESGGMHFSDRDLPKNVRNLEDAGVIFVRGNEYNWHVAETLDAWDAYSKWLDAHPEYELEPSE